METISDPKGTHRQPNKGYTLPDEGITEKENSFYKYIIPILCTAILGLAFTVYRLDQAGQDKITNDIIKTQLDTKQHEAEDEKKFQAIGINLFIICSNMPENSQKCKPIPGIDNGLTLKQ